MTKEEIIKKGNEKFPQDIIEVINDDGSITREDVNFKLRKAYIEGLIDNNTPLSGLPISNAAVLSANRAVISRQSSIDGRVVYNLDEKCFNHEDLVRQFKAGAEWMIKQGISAESEVCKLAERAWIKPINEKQLEHDVYDNFVSGDKVIVQIRKK